VAGSGTCYILTREVATEEPGSTCSYCLYSFIENALLPLYVLTFKPTHTGKNDMTHVLTYKC
jgi:hypothetical protein